MIDKILALTNKYVPLGFAIKGLSKINPKFEKFFTSALASGYTADAAMDYLREKLETESQGRERQRLEHGGENLRPDERASLQTIKESERVPNVLQKGAAIGIGALTGGLSGAGSAALQAASEAGQPQQPEQPQNHPFDYAGGRERTPESDLGSNQQQPQVQPKYDALAGLRQFPALLDFIEREAASGSDALSIGAKARKSKLLSPIIRLIEGKSQEPFESLLTRLMGSQPQQKPSQTDKLGKVMDLIQKRMANRK